MPSALQTVPRDPQQFIEKFLNPAGRPHLPADVICLWQDITPIPANVYVIAEDRRYNIETVEWLPMPTRAAHSIILRRVWDGSVGHFDLVGAKGSDDEWVTMFQDDHPLVKAVHEVYKVDVESNSRTYRRKRAKDAALSMVAVPKETTVVELESGEDNEDDEDEKEPSMQASATEPPSLSKAKRKRESRGKGSNKRSREASSLPSSSSSASPLSQPSSSQPAASSHSRDDALLESGPRADESNSPAPAAVAKDGNNVQQERSDSHNESHQENNALTASFQRKRMSELYKKFKLKDPPRRSRRLPPLRGFRKPRPLFAINDRVKHGKFLDDDEVQLRHRGVISGVKWRWVSGNGHWFYQIAGYERAVPEFMIELDFDNTEENAEEDEGAREIDCILEQSGRGHRLYFKVQCSNHTDDWMPASALDHIDPKIVEEWRAMADCFGDTDADRSHNALLRWYHVKNFPAARRAVRDLASTQNVVASTGSAQPSLTCRRSPRDHASSHEHDLAVRRKPPAPLPSSQPLVLEMDFCCCTGLKTTGLRCTTASCTTFIGLHSFHDECYNGMRTFVCHPHGGPAHPVNLDVQTVGVRNAVTTGFHTVEMCKDTIFTYPIHERAYQVVPKSLAHVLFIGFHTDLSWSTKEFQQVIAHAIQGSSPSTLRLVYVSAAGNSPTSRWKR